MWTPPQKELKLTWFLFQKVKVSTTCVNSLSFLNFFSKINFSQIGTRIYNASVNSLVTLDVLPLLSPPQITKQILRPYLWTPSGEPSFAPEPGDYVRFPSSTLHHAPPTEKPRRLIFWYSTDNVVNRMPNEEEIYNGSGTIASLPSGV